jgi:hypothetical protein
MKVSGLLTVVILLMYKGGPYTFDMKGNRASVTVNIATKTRTKDVS